MYEASSKVARSENKKKLPLTPRYVRYYRLDEGVSRVAEKKNLGLYMVAGNTATDAD